MFCIHWHFPKFNIGLLIKFRVYKNWVKTFLLLRCFFHFLENFIQKIDWKLWKYNHFTFDTVEIRGKKYLISFCTFWEVSNMSLDAWMKHEILSMDKYLNFIKYTYTRWYIFYSCFLSMPVVSFRAQVKPSHFITLTSHSPHIFICLLPDRRELNKYLYSNQYIIQNGHGMKIFLQLKLKISTNLQFFESVCII